MATITVSSALLREKARLIRQVLEQSQMDHETLWNQMNAQVGLLPKDLRASYAYANDPWNETLTTFYENYLQLVLTMETAADAYERGDYDAQISFTPSE